MPLGEFVAPDWSAPLDVAAYISAMPRTARIKGMFPAAVAEGARARGLTLPSARERYLPFSDIPQSEFAILLVEAASTFFPDAPLRGALRELGRSAYPVFVQSMVGRVVLSTAADMPSALAAAAKAYAVALPTCQVDVSDVGKQRAVVSLKNIYYFLDSHHIGVFEGLARSCGVRLHTRVRVRTAFEGDFELTW
jgi:uncharacterized protein (TIGR02265 family)